MKNLLIIAALFVMNCSPIFAQRTADDYKTQIKERRELMKATGKMLDKKILSAAKKSAKSLEKDGWKPLPGESSLAIQLDNKMRQEVLMNGALPQYTIGQGNGVSRTISNAYNAAAATAKKDIAGQFSTELSSVLEQSINDEQKDDEFHTLTKMIEESTQYVAAKLTRVTPLVKMYRERKDGMIEVQAIMAADSRQSLSALFDKMEQENKDLRDRAAEYLSK